MNDISVNVDLSGILFYLEDRVRALFGKSKEAQDASERLSRQVRMETERARLIRCIGMHDPVPLREIYQPTRLMSPKTGEVDPSDVSAIIERGQNIVIYAGPGRGKTTFLHWLFSNLIEDKARLPVLFTLRWTSAVDNLKDFVGAVAAQQSGRRKKRSQEIVLLVDGYDEIAQSQQKTVSETLQEFASLKVGSYVLSSRMHYEIIELKHYSYYIQDFSYDDAVNFLSSFARVYRSGIEPHSLLTEMRDHGFADFAGSPLMLTLACILKSGPMPSLPRNAVGFIRRAVDTLTFRWDEAKGIARTSNIPLDGDERVRCMMRIAYYMRGLEAPEQLVLREAENHLRLLGIRDINVEHLLMEIAQWYGLLVPIGSSSWTFVHKTIHDFLAARFWVETGQFDPRAVQDWGARTAYAACLVPDATQTIMSALRTREGIAAVAEIFYNNPPFDREHVTSSIVSHFVEFGSGASFYERPKFLRIETVNDFFAELPDDLLLSVIAKVAGRIRNRSIDTINACCLSELLLRGHKLNPYFYSEFLGVYGGEDFLFSVNRVGRQLDFTLQNLRPEDMQNQKPNLTLPGGRQPPLRSDRRR
jgi:hypothetical protein